MKISKSLGNLLLQYGSKPHYPRRVHPSSPAPVKPRSVRTLFSPALVSHSLCDTAPKTGEVWVYRFSKKYYCVVMDCKVLCRVMYKVTF